MVDPRKIKLKYPVARLSDPIVRTGEGAIVLGALNGTTHVLESFASGAVKLSPLSWDASTDLPMIVIMNPGGGFVGEDAYYLRVTSQENAEVLLKNQGATKIYRCKGPPATMTTEFHATSGASLYFFQEPTILYSGAKFVSATLITTSVDALVVYSEIAGPGWAADKSVFAFDHWDNSICVVVEDKLVLFDRQVLRGSPRCRKKQGTVLFTDPGGEPLLGYKYLATVVVAGDWGRLALSQERVLHLVEGRVRTKAHFSDFGGCALVRVYADSSLGLREVVSELGLPRRSLLRLP